MFQITYHGNYLVRRRKSPVAEITELAPFALTNMQIRAWQQICKKVEGYQSLMKEEIKDAIAQGYGMVRRNGSIRQTLELFENNGFIENLGSDEYLIHIDRPFSRTTPGRAQRDRGQISTMWHDPISKTSLAEFDLYSNNFYFNPPAYRQKQR